MKVIFRIGYQFPIALFALAVVAIVPTRIEATPIQWSSASGGNDHYYEIFFVSGGISWTDAQADAVSRGGYLVTILSAAENQFVFDSLVNNAAYWNFGFAAPFDTEGSGPWIGALQPSGSGEPSAGWEWLNGEGTLASTYSNWASGEPNNFTAPNENAVLFFDNNTADPAMVTAFWNDWPASSLGPSYVVEYNSAPLGSTPLPAAFPLFGTGLAGMAIATWRRRKSAKQH